MSERPQLSVTAPPSAWSETHQKTIDWWLDTWVCDELGTHPCDNTGGTTPHHETCVMEAVRGLRTELAHLQRERDAARETITALRAAVQALDHLYDRDGIAHIHARQIEKIFDAVLHGIPTEYVNDAALGGAAQEPPR